MIQPADLHEILRYHIHYRRGDVTIFAIFNISHSSQIIRQIVSRFLHHERIPYEYEIDCAC